MGLRPLRIKCFTFERIRRTVVEQTGAYFGEISGLPGAAGLSRSPMDVENHNAVAETDSRRT